MALARLLEAGRGAKANQGEAIALLRGLPEGAIVAMLSGWEQHVATATFRNADDAGGMHFPGFHIEAIELLLGERNVNGIFVDTLSLDFGASADFAVHYRWLPAGKWGIECAANLGALPAAGAHAENQAERRGQIGQ